MKTIIKIAFILLPFEMSAQIWETHSFDTGSSGVYIDTSLSSNVWQIGIPQKPFFNSAYTLPNAILTDTVNPYPNNNLSAFYLTLPNVRWYGVNLFFKYKLNTDSLIDGGKVEVSYDSINWVNLINSTATFMQIGFYSNTDSVSSMGDNGFSGSTNGWQSAWAYWNYPPADTMYLRFVFTSDSNQTNKDGWMLDSINIRTDLGIGINEINNPATFYMYPNPTTNRTYLHFPPQFGTIKSISIISPYGQQITKATNGSYLDLTNLNAGLYFIVVTNIQGEKLFNRVLKE